MANVSPEKDLDRAASFRKMANRTRSSDAKQKFHDAADRLESRAAKKVSKLARGKKRGGVRPPTG